MVAFTFHCAECGRSICRIAAIEQMRLCAACIVLPGWWRDPKVRREIDKDYNIATAAPGSEAAIANQTEA